MKRAATSFMSTSSSGEAPILEVKGHAVNAAAGLGFMAYRRKSAAIAARPRGALVRVARYYFGPGRTRGAWVGLLARLRLGKCWPAVEG
jgi:hypothetical protein